MKLYDVISNKLYGSGLPSNDNEYSRWDDFDSVVSLTEPFRLRYLENVNYEKKFNVLKSPIDDFDAPSYEQGHDICDWIHKELEQGKKVVIHCFIGRGRTGTLLACYLIKYCDYSPDEAIKAVRKKNPEAIETRPQVNFVKNFK
ncbi:MAG: dual specificity protein phosphatase family protein [Cyanobacteriota bacterium]